MCSSEEGPGELCSSLCLCVACCWALEAGRDRGAALPQARELGWSAQLGTSQSRLTVGDSPVLLPPQWKLASGKVEAAYRNLGREGGAWSHGSRLSPAPPSCKVPRCKVTKQEPLTASQSFATHGLGGRRRGPLPKCHSPSGWHPKRTAPSSVRLCPNL